VVVRQARYVVSCRRDGSEWALEVIALGLTARAAHLSEVEAVARDLVASYTDEDPASCRVVVDIVVRHTVTELLAAAAAARANPDDLSVEAVTMRRGLAQRLSEQGFGGEDVATLLGLSYVRALQLISERPHATTRESAVPKVSTLRDHHRFESAVPALVDDAPSHEGRDERPHSTYRHEAFLYDGEQQFLAGTVPFILDGVALGQPVMVALVPDRLELLRTAVGAEGADVYWVDMAELGGNPGRIVPAWRRFVDEHGTAEQPVRGIGEPIWAGRRPAELEECQLHEALLNLAVAPDTPLWLRCPYDVESLPDAVVEESMRSHPAVVERGDYRGSTLYGGATHASNIFGTELAEPDVEVEEWHFDRRGLRQERDGRTGAAMVRHLVQQRAATVGLAPARRADLALSVNEAANNSVRHGGGRGVLRMWHDHESLTCEVRDTGHITDPLVGRRMPPPAEARGRGLWLVHQLSDLAQIRSTDRGSTVRITSWL
jgi:anti-sigma regulatory factor (Ser/Thr protein kinase)